MCQFERSRRFCGTTRIWFLGTLRPAPGLKVVEGTLNAVGYTNMLDTYYQPSVEEIYPHGNMFQQDGAPAHTASHTQEYFLLEGMTVMPWPSRSTDMDCIENARELLVRSVYSGARQFGTVDDLK